MRMMMGRRRKRQKMMTSKKKVRKMMSCWVHPPPATREHMEMVSVQSALRPAANKTGLLDVDKLDRIC